MVGNAATESDRCLESEDELLYRKLEIIETMNHELFGSGAALNQKGMVNLLTSALEGASFADPLYNGFIWMLAYVKNRPEISASDFRDAIEQYL